jgi:hypothetical protein
MDTKSFLPPGCKAADIFDIAERMTSLKAFIVPARGKRGFNAYIFVEELHGVCAVGGDFPSRNSALRALIDCRSTSF